jgi:hypothetical protein
MVIQYDPVVAPPCVQQAQRGTFALYKWILARKWGNPAIYVRRIKDDLDGLPTDGSFKPREPNPYEIVSCRPKDNKPGNSYSIHGDGRAMDVGMPIVNGSYQKYIGDTIAALMIKYSEQLKIQSMVFHEHDWNPRDGWTSFGGSNHRDHIHIEQNWEGSRLSEAQILTILSQEDNDLPYSEKDLKRIIGETIDSRLDEIQDQAKRAIDSRLGEIHEQVKRAIRQVENTSAAELQRLRGIDDIEVRLQEIENKL